LTDISDPYEVPADAEVTMNTCDLSSEQAAQEIIQHVERGGCIGTAAESVYDQLLMKKLKHLHMNLLINRLVGFGVGTLIGTTGLGGGGLLLPILGFGWGWPDSRRGV
jgi:hypothetical protein